MENDLKNHIAQIANYVQAQGIQPSLIDALKMALRDDSDDAPLLLRRVPVLCMDMREVKLILAKQASDASWVKWILGLLVSGVGLLLVKSLGF